MDIERVQKINSLALELLKQGLVSDREEAVKQAERIMDRGDYSSLQETMSGGKRTDLEVAGKESGLAQDKISEILEKNTTFIVKKMREFQEQMEKINGEIGNLRNEMSGVKREMNSLKSSGVTKPSGEEPKRKPVAKESGGVKDHPRSGNYKEDDVSIEKFFYAGNK